MLVFLNPPPLRSLTFEGVVFHEIGTPTTPFFVSPNVLGKDRTNEAEANDGEKPFRPWRVERRAREEAE